MENYKTEILSVYFCGSFGFALFLAPTKVSWLRCKIAPLFNQDTDGFSHESERGGNGAVQGGN